MLMKSYLPNDIKDENRKIIFDILLDNPELAKVEIAERTAMSLVTVSKVVNFFEEIGLLKITGESREGAGGLGRKRTVYRFNKNKYVAIGLQLIGKELTALLVNLDGEILYTCTSEIETPFYSEDFVSIFKKTILMVSEQTEGIILGVGIGVDGAINTRKKIIRMRLFDGIEKDFYYEEILTRLEESVNFPIVLENDVNAATVAEYWNHKETLEESGDLIYISAGEGVGAGLIINKELYKGFNASAGELEYMCFDTEYKKSESSIGWLENKISINRLLGIYQLDSEDRVNACVEYLSKKLALAIVNITSILDINQIVLSGKTIALFPERVLASTKKYVNQYTDWMPNILISDANNSTALGVAILALRREILKVIST